MSVNFERDEAMCVCGHHRSVHTRVFSRRGHCTATRGTKPCRCNIFREDQQ